MKECKTLLHIYLTVFHFWKTKQNTTFKQVLVIKAGFLHHIIYVVTVGFRFIFINHLLTIVILLFVMFCCLSFNNFQKIAFMSVNKPQQPA